MATLIDERQEEEEINNEEELSQLTKEPVEQETPQEEDIPEGCTKKLKSY
jgi:hypothetical protein